MLEHLSIKNFQCHETLQLELTDPITVIVGESDKGKSAIIRALRWLTNNRPSGDAYVRKGSGGCSVRLSVDGHKILRRRKAGSNLYKLDTRTFNAFGTEVPTDIQQRLNLGPVNFQLQHDPPWLLAKTSGEIARELNSVVDLQLIDRTLANLASELRTSKTNVQVIEDRLKEAREQRNALKWVVDADKALKEMERLEQDMEDNQQLQESLSEALTELGEQIHIQEHSQSTIIALERVVEAGTAVLELTNQADGLDEALVNLEESEKEACRLHRDVTLRSEEFRNSLKGQCPLCGQQANVA